MKLGERVGDIFPTTRHWEAGEWFVAPVALMLVVSGLVWIAYETMVGVGLISSR